MRRGIASLLALAIVLVAAAILTTSANAAQTVAGIATDQILQPPNQADGKPIDVVIGLHVVNLAAIDEVSEQFQLNAYLFAQWIDQRLAFTPQGPQDQIRSYRPGQVWTPQLEMLNAAAPRARRGLDHGESGRHCALRRTALGKAVLEVRAAALPVRQPAANSAHPPVPDLRAEYQVRAQ